MGCGGRGTEVASNQGWQMERCRLAPPALTEQAEVKLPSPASFCAWYKVVVLLQQGDAMGITSLEPHSAWKHQFGTPFCMEADILDALEWGQIHKPVISAYSWTRHMLVAKSFPLAQHSPRSPVDSGQKQGWLHWAFSSSCSHPAALLPPSVMTFPLLS